MSSTATPSGSLPITSRTDRPPPRSCRLHVAPDRAAGPRRTLHRGVDVGDRDAEPLEAGSDERGRWCTRRTRLLPLEEVDRAGAVVEAACTDAYPRVPAGAVEAERRARFRLLGCGAHRSVEPADVGVEAARAFEVGAVDVDVEDPGVAHPKAHCNERAKICEAEDVLPDGIVVVVKRSCPTCQLVTGVLDRLERGPAPLTVYAQDDTDFRPGTRDDTELEISFAYDIDTVPTVLRVERGEVVGRTEGWRRDRWEEITGAHPLGTDLPEWRPGCGSRTHDPDVQDALTIARLEPSMQARRIELGSDEDDAEAMFARGWSDGLPLVPPTVERVARMLAATPRDPQDLVAVIPPDLVDCTVEKVAINAVMAGCRPEYLPVVLTAVEAACTDEFNMHGVLATTWFSGPMVIVNGPITARSG